MAETPPCTCGGGRVWTAGKGLPTPSLRTPSHRPASAYASVFHLLVPSRMKKSLLLLACLIVAIVLVLVSRHRSGEGAVQTTPPLATADAAAAPAAVQAAPAPADEPVAATVPVAEFGAAAVEVQRQPDFRKVVAFNDWARQWQAADAAGRTAMQAEGVRLAAERRAEFKALIATDPQRALEQAVPRVILQDLPAEIAPGLFARLTEVLATKPEAIVVFELPGEIDLAPEGWTLLKRLGKGARQPTVAFFRRS